MGDEFNCHQNKQTPRFARNLIHLIIGIGLEWVSSTPWLLLRLLELLTITVANLFVNKSFGLLLGLTRKKEWEGKVNNDDKLKPMQDVNKYLRFALASSIALRKIRLGSDSTAEEKWKFNISRECIYAITSSVAKCVLSWQDATGMSSGKFCFPLTKI